MADEPVTNPSEEQPQDADESQVESEAEAVMAEALAQAQNSIDDMHSLAESAGQSDQPDDLAGIDLLNDVDLNVMIELGRTPMLVEDVLKLQSGSVVELDKLAGDPVDVYVNHRLIARGEVLVLNDNFCIRISEIVDNLTEQATEAAEQQLAGSAT